MTTAGNLDTGARIGRYVVIERVGTGAMGVVYGAYDPELDRKIALKLLKPGQVMKEKARARLFREAKAIARLSHPNVVAVHDVGVFEGQVFLAMEFVAGVTLKDWLAGRSADPAAGRSWRQILEVFAGAGRGLAAAHAAGIVHRDFKPDNVLIDKEGRPRVVDFGIARQAGGGGAAGADGDRDHDHEEESGEGHRPGQAAAVTEARLRESTGAVAPLLTLTKTGALVGTPAYMAPEQFLGQRGDERSDQFTFCVTLYEALYGERPFQGEDVLSLSLNVTQEQLRPLPKERGVPAWVRRAILRGLKADPGARWASMAALLAALAEDPAAKVRRRLLTGGIVALVTASLLFGWQAVSRRRAELDRQIAGHLEEAARATATATAKEGEARKLRAEAFAAFERLDKPAGEERWRAARALLPAIDAGYDAAERSLETALLLDPARATNRARLADLRYQHLLFAEELRLGGKAGVLEERLASVDADGSRRRRLHAAARLTIRVTPAPSRIALERYDRDPVTGRRKPIPLEPVDPGERATPFSRALPPGSYRLTVEAPGTAEVIYPFEATRAEPLAIELVLPAAATVPEGFVYVPPGQLWFGDPDEQLRTQFLSAVPIHQRRTGAFLIARQETTYREWIAFLSTLDPGERARLAPNVSAATRGSLRLRDEGDTWQLTFQPTSHRYSAAVGSPINYVGRKTLTQQDWLRFPVAGVSPADVDRYLGWLRSTRRVPGARLCTELEWERAARGADGRLFPHGDEVAPDEANFDLTYGRVDSAYGPDMVGSHRASRSPFGADDMMGNVFELVRSSVRADELVIRGGAYYFAAINGRSTNREPVPSTFRDVTVGIRVCASIQGETR